MIDMMTSFFFLSSTFLSYIAIHLHYLHMLVFFFVSQFFLTAKACSTYDTFFKTRQATDKQIEQTYCLVIIIHSVFLIKTKSTREGLLMMLSSPWQNFWRSVFALLLLTVFIASFHDTKEVMKLMYIILYILAVIYLIEKKILRFFLFRILMN